MKHKILVLMLALTMVSWAQTATQTEPSAPQKSQAKCACCDKMASADSKDAGMSCARHSASSKDGKDCCAGKDAMSCCSGKDGTSCMKDTKNASCCKDGCGNGKDKTASACCEKDCKGGCCSKKSESAMNCCDRHDHS